MPTFILCFLVCYEMCHILFLCLCPLPVPSDFFFVFTVDLWPLTQLRAHDSRSLFSWNYLLSQFSCLYGAVYLERLTWQCCWAASCLAEARMKVTNLQISGGLLMQVYLWSMEIKRRPGSSLRTIASQFSRACAPSIQPFNSECLNGVQQK